jgi:hypothetical protein
LFATDPSLNKLPPTENLADGKDVGNKVKARMILHFGSTFPTRISEWALACILASWGLMLLRDDDTFGSSQAYLGLARLASESVWGWACLLAGAVRLVALVINGAWTPTYHFRSLLAFLSCFFWMQISLGLMATGNASTGLAVYPWLLLTDIYCTYRAARDFRMAQSTEV